MLHQLLVNTVKSKDSLDSLVFLQASINGYANYIARSSLLRLNSGKQVLVHQQ